MISTETTKQWLSRLLAWYHYTFNREGVRNCLNQLYLSSIIEECTKTFEFFLFYLIVYKCRHQIQDCIMGGFHCFSLQRRGR